MTSIITVSLIKLIEKIIYQNKELSSIITQCYRSLPKSFSIPFATIEAIKSKAINTLSSDFQKTTLDISLYSKITDNKLEDEWHIAIINLFNMKIFDDDIYEHSSLVIDYGLKAKNNNDFLSFTIIDFFSEIKK